MSIDEKIVQVRIQMDLRRCTDGNEVDECEVDLMDIDPKG